MLPVSIQFNSIFFAPKKFRDKQDFDNGEQNETKRACECFLVLVAHLQVSQLCASGWVIIIFLFLRGDARLEEVFRRMGKKKYNKNKGVGCSLALVVFGSLRERYK